MKVADLDIQRLSGPAGSAERDKDADTNQKPEQITSPMHVRANPWFVPTPFQKDIVRPPPMACRFVFRDFQATPFIVPRNAGPVRERRPLRLSNSTPRRQMRHKMVHIRAT
jgi:hypothetical protein